MLCGEPISRGASYRDGALYEKVHSDCIDFAVLHFPGFIPLTFNLRKQFLLKRAEQQPA
jgi:hypothetical protein